MHVGVLSNYCPWCFCTTIARGLAMGESLRRYCGLVRQVVLVVACGAS